MSFDIPSNDQYSDVVPYLTVDKRTHQFNQESIQEKTTRMGVYLRFNQSLFYEFQRIL